MKPEPQKTWQPIDTAPKGKTVTTDDISMEAANKIVDILHLRMVDILLINHIITEALIKQHNKTCGEFR